MSKQACARCGGAVPTIDNVVDTSTWYGFQVKTETATTTSKSIRILISHVYGRYSQRGEHVMRADDTVPLCFDCGGLLVSRFMQGRDVPAFNPKGGE